jgi:hypothetical protein
VLQDRCPGVVLEAHVGELDVAADVRDRPARHILLVFGDHPLDLANAIEAGQRLGHLRADVGELDDRDGDQGGKRQVHDEVADRHLAGADGRAADQHHRDADGAEDQRGEC